MKIECDVEAIKANLDEPIEVNRYYEGQAAENKIDELVDAYSGCGFLIIPLDREARDTIAEAEKFWASGNC